MYKGLMLDVMWSKKECYIHRPVIGTNVETQLSIANSVNSVSSKDIYSVVKWNVDNTKLQGDNQVVNVSDSSVFSIQMVTIRGPSVPKSLLPEKLRDFCPDDFDVVTTKDVIASQENIEEEAKFGTMEIRDLLHLNKSLASK